MVISQGLEVAGRIPAVAAMMRAPTPAETFLYNLQARVMHSAATSGDMVEWLLRVSVPAIMDSLTSLEQHLASHINAHDVAVTLWSSSLLGSLANQLLLSLLSASDLVPYQGLLPALRGASDILARITRTSPASPSISCPSDTFLTTWTKHVSSHSSVTDAAAVEPVVSEMFRCAGASAFIVSFDASCAVPAAVSAVVITDSFGGTHRWTDEHPRTLTISTEDAVHVRLEPRQKHVRWSLRMTVVALSEPHATSTLTDLTASIALLCGELVGQMASITPQSYSQRTRSTSEAPRFSRMASLRSFSRMQSGAEEYVNIVTFKVINDIAVASLNDNPEASKVDVCQMEILRGGMLAPEPPQCCHGGGDGGVASFAGDCTAFLALVGTEGIIDHVLVRVCRDSKRRHAQVFGNKSIDVAIADTFAAILHHTPAVLEEACMFLQSLQPGDVEEASTVRGRMPNQVLSRSRRAPAAVLEAYDRAETLRVPMVKQRQRTKSQIFDSLTELRIEPTAEQGTLIEAKSEVHVSKTSERARFLLAIVPYHSDLCTDASSATSADTSACPSARAHGSEDDSHFASSFGMAATAMGLKDGAAHVLEFVQYWSDTAIALPLIVDRINALRLAAEHRIECLQLLTRMLDGPGSASHQDLMLLHGFLSQWAVRRQVRLHDHVHVTVTSPHCRRRSGTTALTCEAAATCWRGGCAVCTVSCWAGLPPSLVLLPQRLCATAPPTCWCPCAAWTGSPSTCRPCMHPRSHHRCVQPWPRWARHWVASMVVGLRW